MNNRYEQALKRREEARVRLAPTIARMEAEGKLPKPLSKEQIEMLAKLEEECGGILCGNPKDFLTESEEVVWKRANPYTPLADMPDNEEEN